jgi:hypothetical protein
MPLATYIGTTEAAHILRSEDIEPFLEGFNFPPPISIGLATYVPGKGNVPHRFPRLAQLAVPAGTLAETVDAVDVNVATAEASITPARVAFAVPISEELMMGQDFDAMPSAVIEEIYKACWFRVNADLCAAVAAGTTSTIGAVTDIFTLDHLRTAKAAARALNLHDELALVVHTDGLGALEESAETAGSPFAMNAASDFNMFPGYQGKVRGLQLFWDSQVTAESTGHDNYISPMGARSGLGVVVSTEPKITMHEGNDGLRRAVIYAHVKMRYGVGVRNVTRILEVLSD